MLRRFLHHVKAQSSTSMGVPLRQRLILLYSRGALVWPLRCNLSRKFGNLLAQQLGGHLRAAVGDLALAFARGRALEKLPAVHTPADALRRDGIPPAVEKEGRRHVRSVDPIRGNGSRRVENGATADLIVMDEQLVPRRLVVGLWHDKYEKARLSAKRMLHKLYCALVLVAKGWIEPND